MAKCVPWGFHSSLAHSMPYESPSQAFCRAVCQMWTQIISLLSTWKVMDSHRSYTSYRLCFCFGLQYFHGIEDGGEDYSWGLLSLINTRAYIYWICLDRIPTTRVLPASRGMYRVYRSLASLVSKIVPCLFEQKFHCFAGVGLDL